MGIELLRFQTERLVEKQANVERLAARHMARVTAEIEAAERKLREEHEALFGPPAPACDEAGAPALATPTDERAQFARNKELMQQGLRGG
jgi:hypothetical protein